MSSIAAGSLKHLYKPLFSLIAVMAMSAPAAADHTRSARHSTHHASRDSHVVNSGETLWGIARSRGCTVDDVARANHIDRTVPIQPGQKLRIPSCRERAVRAVARATEPERAPITGAVITHTVVSGDTLSAIAHEYDTTVDALQRRNHLNGTIIRPGQGLEVPLGREGVGRPIPGQSIGGPHHGRLVHGIQLPKNRYYVRRRLYRAWGTTQLVHYVEQTAELVGHRYKVHKVAIGDISEKHGGHISPHKSHQSGRDVDIGFYFKKQPRGYPDSFIVGTRHNLDMAANWLMLKSFCDTADEPGGVKMIFLDYQLQKLFYHYAKKHGVKQKVLDRMFQYPHGRGTNHGIIHWAPGHDDHIHVRFKCPVNDDRCG